MSSFCSDAPASGPAKRKRNASATSARAAPAGSRSSVSNAMPAGYPKTGIASAPWLSISATTASISAVSPSSKFDP